MKERGKWVSAKIMEPFVKKGEKKVTIYNCVGHSERERKQPCTDFPFYPRDRKSIPADK